MSAGVTPNTVQGVIKNQGNAPVPVGNWFWVDFTSALNPVPTGVYQVWGVNDAALLLDLARRSRCPTATVTIKRLAATMPGRCLSACPSMCK